MKFSALVAGAAAALLPAWAAAQSVALQGMLGNKALLIVEGSAPKTVAPGETFMGVKVISTSGDTAVIEVGGKRATLRVGESPASVGGGGPTSSGSRIVLAAGPGGHFLADGRINGQQVRFIVDTGATSVAISEREAQRLRLPYKEGRQTMTGTANGAVPTWQIKLPSVRIGDVEVRDVDASVLPADMPFILLGNSFLDRFQMKRENEQMTLERRY
jgi:aspartyl protease family protein